MKKTTLTPLEAFQKHKDEEDCHASPEDGCSGCQRALEGGVYIEDAGHFIETGPENLIL